MVFADIDKLLVNSLNLHREYNVVIKGENEEVIPVNNVRAVHLYNEDSLLNELDNVSIAAVSVGQNGLPGVAKILARSLERRTKTCPGSPLDLIIAENLRDSDIVLKNELIKHLPKGFPLETNIGLVETSIGKMVPYLTGDQIQYDSLTVFAERYNTLILSKNSFLNPIPDLPELEPKENIKAWVDRKLFIHNFGHASLAYLSALKNPDFTCTWEALADKSLYFEVYETMRESAFILQSMYPNEFLFIELEEHIKDLLKRFANKSLGDTLYRVGSDVPRKLSSEDRIVPLIRYAHNNNLSYKRILKVLAAGILFSGKDINGNMNEADSQFIKLYNRKAEKILQNHCKFDVSREKDIFVEMKTILSELI